MPFQAPITISTALQRMQRHDYVLPAIQREFVWSEDQICKLFDSLMRGYPIGSFLFWKVDKQNVENFVFFDFVRNFHELTGRHCPMLDLPRGEPVQAILDGQQRLTSLNIGLRGSYAAKLPRKRRTSLDAYPKKTLHLNLLARPDAGEIDMAYEFRFLTDSQAAAQQGTAWFPVHRIMSMDSGPALFEFIQSAGLANDASAFKTLFRLHSLVNQDLIINYYEEEDSDIDKVLNIFIRVNSQGTPLSYSDLLLSIATAQWNDTDAREAVYGLVDELNHIGQGFSISKDLVLKAGLAIIDAPDIRFKVSNFNSVNMRLLESSWPEVGYALKRAVRLLADFGFSEMNLRAHSVLIPLAYYLHQREVGDDYLSAMRYEDDRRLVRQWVVRSLVKAGVWGSGLDTLLGALRTALRENSADGFPIDRIEAAMARLGKSLRFESEEIDDLTEIRYGNPSMFPILSLLYPNVNVRGAWHEDHIFPRSLFFAAKLRKHGIEESRHWDWADRSERLPNMQLLEGPQNIHKSDALPMAWLTERFPDATARGLFLAANDIHDLPDELAGFESFYDRRRERLGERLRNLLTDEPEPSGPATSNSPLTP